MLKSRYLSRYVAEDLSKKMVFIGGPRQVGKTTLAREIVGKQFSPFTYLNWDFSEDRKKILKLRFRPDSRLIIFDEIHKYRNWKNYIKGLYDKKGAEFKILVTGSARLNVYRRGADSLLGRNFYYRLHPFSVAELLKTEQIFNPGNKMDIPEVNRGQNEMFDLLFKFGGFPEPLMEQDEKTLRRWHTMRIERIVKEDIRDIEDIKNLSGLHILVDNLPDKVASLLSINSLAEDLSVSHKTVSHWLNILENIYYHFRIYPYTERPLKSLKKMPKLYLWDWSEIENNDSAKLENIIASHLLKFCHYLYDIEGYKSDLHYFRDRDGREVDFIVTINKKIWFAVEVKTTAKTASPNLRYFIERMKVPFAFQVVMEDDIDFMSHNIRVISAPRFLAALI